MPPKFSCADFTFPLLPHEKVFDLLRLLDFKAVDLGIFEGRSHLWPSHVASDPQAAAARLRRTLDQRGLLPADVFLQTGPEPSVAAANAPSADVRKRNREMFSAVAAFAVTLGASHLTGLPGVRHEGVAWEQDWQRAVEEAAWRCRHCHEAGLVYAVEAHVGSITPDPENAERLISDVPGLTLTLDYGHFIYQGLPNETVHPLLEHASHIHARGGAPGHLQTTVTGNRIDFAAMIGELKRRRYKGYLCLEYVYIDWEGCNRTDNLSETLMLRDFLHHAAEQIPCAS